MSRYSGRALLLGIAASAALLAGAAGFAGAGTLESLLDGGLAPSDAPALLGPITESGRTGWECKPEIAAGAKTAAAADLPQPVKP